MWRTDGESSRESADAVGPGESGVPSAAWTLHALREITISESQYTLEDA